jgi:hypothetical protein
MKLTLTNLGFVLLLLCSMFAQGQVLPSERSGGWLKGVTIGLPAGLPVSRPDLVDASLPPFSADKTGTRDASSAIQAAINSAKAGQTVYLPAGTYIIEKTISIGPGRDNITLRGEGNLSVLKSRVTTSACISIGSEGDWDWKRAILPVSSNVVKGSTVLPVSDTSQLGTFPNGGVGSLVRIQLDNDNDLPVIHVSGFNGLRRQMVRIVAKSQNTITVFPAVQFNLPLNLNPKLSVALYQVEGVGVENLRIDSSEATGNAAFTIKMSQCYGTWIKNVKMERTPNFHVYMLSCLQCEVSGCDIRERKVVGPNGAGIMVNNTSSSLFEDNIIFRIFPHIEVNSGSTGNVFAYNFCEDNDVGNLMGASIDSNHNPHNSFNLYEGNIASKFQCDGYFGSSSDDTLFRNWFHGTSQTTSNFGMAINLNRFTRNYNVIGNILGRMGSYSWIYQNSSGPGNYSQRYIYGLGFPNMGNLGASGVAEPSRGKFWSDWGKSPGSNGFQEMDLDVAKTTLRLGNYNYLNNAVPQGEALGGALPESLYLNGKPAWFGNLQWPSF